MVPPRLSLNVSKESDKEFYYYLVSVTLAPEGLVCLRILLGLEAWKTSLHQKKIFWDPGYNGGKLHILKTN